MPSSGGGISDPIPGPGDLELPRDITQTLLSLERFARVINYSPMSMHGVWVTDLQPPESCSDPVLQYSWQPRGGGQPGRAEIAQSIRQAEDMIEEYAGFSVRPRWVLDDTANTPRLLSNSWIPNYYKVKASLGYIVQGGRDAWSPIQAGGVITYGDRDNDGYEERASVVVATSVTDANEIEVYYPGTQHDQGWEIRPISVVISGGQAAITFPRHLAVIPDLLERLDAVGVDGMINENFLSTVDVWRHYNDPSQMATVEWEPGLCQGTGDVNDVAAQAAYITPTDRRNSLVNVRPGAYDAVSGWQYACVPCWGPPTRIRLWYRAGFRDERLARPMQEMSPDLERAVSYLALAYMDREWTTCEQIRNVMDTWRQDLAHREPGSGSFNVSRGMLDNPFGTARAAVYAWNVVKKLQVGEAVLGG